MPYDGKLLARARGELDRIRTENREQTRRRYNEVTARLPEIRKQFPGAFIISVE